EHGRGLHAELQAARVLGLTQRLVGRQLLETVMPVGQTGDVLILHRGQQALPGGALLEAVDGRHVVEQERQVEDLDLLGVVLEFGQRWGDQLYVAEQQRLHFLAIAEQRGVRVDLDAYLVAQALFGQLLEQQGTLALGCVFGDDVGELDDDGGGFGGLAEAGNTEGQGAEQRLGRELEHARASSCCDCAGRSQRLGRCRTCATVRQQSKSKGCASGLKGGYLQIKSDSLQLTCGKLAFLHEP